MKNETKTTDILFGIGILIMLSIMILGFVLAFIQDTKKSESIQKNDSINAVKFLNREK